jgi:hypothetical protein
VSMVTVSRKRARVYPRKFDHDEARELYARGFSAGRLALKYGVTVTAIRRVLDPELRAKMQARVDAYRRSGVCERCGGPCVPVRHRSKQVHNPDGRELCKGCRAIVRRKPIRLSADGVLLGECGSCHTWKPLAEFPPRVQRAIANGRVAKWRCRACETAERRDYRHRNRERERAYERAYRAKQRAAGKP